MSYLDNLENNLKAMESREERRPVRTRDQRARQEAERAKAATAPFAEQLRHGPFTTELMNEATRLGFGLRTKVYMTWVDGALRLDARDHRMELRATPQGVIVRFSEQGNLTKEEAVNLDSSAKKLAERWIGEVGPRPAATP
jgi:hypothetical protein